MKTIGLYLAIFGAGSIVLNMFGYEFSLLVWVDNWGSTVGWFIRGGAIVIGLALFALGGSSVQTSPNGGETSST